MTANSEELVKYQEMRIELEFSFFRSLGYDPDTCSEKNKKFLSAEKADEILKEYYK